MKHLIILLLLPACTTIKYVERPIPDYLKDGCQVPYAQPFDDFLSDNPNLCPESMTERECQLYTDGRYVRAYSDSLKKAMCECDADTRRFTGEPITDRMAGVCGIGQNQ